MKRAKLRMTEMSSSEQFGWKSMLHSNAPPTSSLTSALFTTYDRAEERLLAEHLLPILLKLNYGSEGKDKERKLFLVELQERLNRQRIVVVSSTLREEPADLEEPGSSTYEWIWRSIQPLRVGRNGDNAVQHAKLWMLHWSDIDGAEYIEIMVSSANLTHSSFQKQLQAGWRTLLALEPKASQTRLREWGVLPEFLSELAKSASTDSKCLDFFRELLSRAKCPKNIQFVASVPGKHNRKTLRRTPWGVEGLSKIFPPGRMKVGVSILAPYIGQWDKKEIIDWCSAFGGTPERLELVWIDKNHPWKDRWQLPKTSLSTLIQVRSTLLRLRRDPSKNKAHTDQFHRDHRSVDERWSHAKIYAFKRGGSHSLLVTSANFSAAAWGRRGKGGETLTIGNFELGVWSEKSMLPLFGGLECFDDLNDVAVSNLTENKESNIITWFSGVWDGRRVKIECRCKSPELNGEMICGGDQQVQLTKWSIDAAGNVRSTEVSWADAKHPPLYVSLKSESETVRFTVFDERKYEQRLDMVPPELEAEDADVLQSMRDDLLFEQYGGRIAEDEDNGLGITGSDKQSVKGNESYAVPALVQARERLSIVDNWAQQVKDAEETNDDNNKLEWLRRDGEKLTKAFERRGKLDAPMIAIGAKLAAEEMELRLRHLQNENEECNAKD